MPGPSLSLSPITSPWENSEWFQVLGPVAWCCQPGWVQLHSKALTRSCRGAPHFALYPPPHTITHFLLAESISSPFLAFFSPSHPPTSQSFIYSPTFNCIYYLLTTFIHCLSPVGDPKQLSTPSDNTGRQNHVTSPTEHQGRVGIWTWVS